MRPLSDEERALWAKVVASVKPLRAVPAPEQAASAQPLPTPSPRPPRPQPAPLPSRGPGHTLDGGWDRRLARGMVQPDVAVDLHGHNLATAYELLDRRLEQAVASGARLMLLITGKPPTSREPPVRRGAIRAAVGDWLAASRHAGSIAAVRSAHPRHGGSGALYIVLRRRR